MKIKILFVFTSLFFLAGCSLFFSPGEYEHLIERSNLESSPEISIDQPAGGTIVTDESLTVTGKSSDAVNVEKSWVGVCRPGGKIIWMQTENPSNFVFKTNLREGVYDLYASVYDGYQYSYTGISNVFVWNQPSVQKNIHQPDAFTRFESPGSTVYFRAPLKDALGRNYLAWNFTLSDGQSSGWINQNYSGFVLDISGSLNIQASNAYIVKTYSNNQYYVYPKNSQNPDFSVSEGVFVGIEDPCYEINDFNGDGYPDLIGFGDDADDQTVTMLYLNGGNGQFTPVSNFGVNLCKNVSADSGDIDGDGDADLLISGYFDYDAENDFNYTGPAVFLYRNNGNAEFERITGSGMKEIYYGDSRLFDADLDGDLDVLISGVYYLDLADDDFDDTEMLLYLNDGSGRLTLADHEFTGIKYNILLIEDLDMDGDQDIIAAGKDENSSDRFLLYENKGGTDFSLVAVQTNLNISYVDGVTADFNSDGLIDLMFLAKISIYDDSPVLFLNQGNLSFNVQTNLGIPDYTEFMVTDMDYNGDGKIDLLISGDTNWDDYAQAVYTNNGNAFFADAGMTFSSSLYDGIAVSADFNQDGWKDAVMAGLRGSDDDPDSLILMSRQGE